MPAERAKGGSRSILRHSMKAKALIKAALVLIIILTAIFLYLYLTRSTLLQNIPYIPQRTTPPVFSSYLDGAFSSPVGVTSDALDYVYVADTHNSRVVVYDNNGARITDFGQKNLKSPVSLAVLFGSVYVADLGTQDVKVFTKDGTLRQTLVASGANGDIGTFTPTALAVDEDQGWIYFTDASWHRVVVVDRDGNYMFSFGRDGSGRGELLYPNGIALDSTKNIYVADSNNGRIQVFSPDGSQVLHDIRGGQSAQEAFSLPRGIAVDGADNLWVVDALAHNVTVFHGDRRLYSFGSLGVEEGELYFPNNIAFDSVGRIYVTERGLDRVSVFAFPRASLGIRR